MVAISQVNKITCGINEFRLGLESHGVEAVRQSLGDVLNVDLGAVAFVDGRVVGGDYRLGRGEALEFFPTSGAKGILEPDEFARRERGDLAPTAQSESADVLQVCRDTFTVSYRGTSCFLGNRKPFQVIERLNRKPGYYISIDTLRNDVWNDDMIEKSTIQKTVSNLRKRLQAEGLSGVVIDGAQPDHYSLKLQSASGNSA